MEKSEVHIKNIEAISDFIFDKIPDIIEAFGKLEPKDKIEVWLKLAEFAFPHNHIIQDTEAFGFDEN